MGRLFATVAGYAISFAGIQTTLVGIAIVFLGVALGLVLDQ